MVSARFTSFLLIFILLPLRFSTAHTQHQVKKRVAATTGSMLETARSSVNVEIYRDVPAVGESDQRARFFPGRKMMSRGSTTEAKDRCIDGKCNQVEGKGNLSVKHKFSNRGSGHYKKVNGFIPLNADYYVPRPHPPKNN